MAAMSAQETDFGYSGFHTVADQLSEIGRDFYHRGWLYGTSGNLSAVLGSEPLRLAITATGVDKGRLSPSHMLEIDGNGEVIRGVLRPSSETFVHLAIVRNRHAGAVFHTHSVWSTVLSERYASRGGIEIRNYEMLKGLENVRTHQHREWIPVLGNSQDMRTLSQEIGNVVRLQPLVHGIVLRGHGLYTWGSSIEDAKRHVEVLEFLLEVLGLTGLRSGGLQLDREKNVEDTAWQ